MVTLPLESIREIVLPLKLETKMVAAWAVPAIEANPKARKRATTAPFTRLVRWSPKVEASEKNAPDQALGDRIAAHVDGPGSLSKVTRSIEPEGVAERGAGRNFIQQPLAK